MTSITNYESVELPIEPVKEKRTFFDYFKNLKGKKPGFSVYIKIERKKISLSIKLITRCYSIQSSS